MRMHHDAVMTVQERCDGMERRIEGNKASGEVGESTPRDLTKFGFFGLFLLRITFGISLVRLTTPLLISAFFTMTFGPQPSDIRIHGIWPSAFLAGIRFLLFFFSFFCFLVFSSLLSGQ